MKHTIDPETELPIGPFKPDPVSQEIRDEETLDNFERAFDLHLRLSSWSIDEEG